ncbi:MAG TPA: trypsin-like peptidase domain-containing protein [Roseiflexaceae bacterium]|nr:trypsin-like peptidase domain-containing protein [Roseiflexaceae bacterium]
MSTPTAGDQLRALSNQMADAVAQSRGALVLVNGRQRQPASGVVYADEIILTADHVLERDDDLSIETDDGRTLAARLVGRDPVSDLAVLRVDGLGLAAATTSSEAARVGQIILAIGRPSSSGPMASLGVVSAVGGPIRTPRGMVEQVIQTDATPYPGFSGGPLIDATGAVVGLLTTGLIGGVALALPVAFAWRTAEALARQGHVKRGFLGISSQPVNIPPAQRGGRDQEHGLLIVRVENDTPAARAGLLVGDILVSLDGQRIGDTDDLQALLSGERVGKAVPVEVVRGGEIRSFTITIGQR